MAKTGCTHTDGSYPSDKVEDGKGNVVATHWRCNSCGIIVATK